jgi:hypothetical protein
MFYSKIDLLAEEPYQEMLDARRNFHPSKFMTKDHLKWKSLELAVQHLKGSVRVQISPDSVLLFGHNVGGANTLSSFVRLLIMYTFTKCGRAYVLSLIAFGLRHLTLRR